MKYLAADRPHSSIFKAKYYLYYRYLGILGTLFEKIFESLTDAEDREEGEAPSEKHISEKYKDKFNEIGKYFGNWVQLHNLNIDAPFDT